MASFKVCIADPKTGKTFQKEIKDQEAQGFIGMNIGEEVKGDGFGLEGYSLAITGGSDFCGFPMRKGILGIRKKITSIGGVGFRSIKKGTKLRKTVCGHKINDKISQINLKIAAAGQKPLEELFPQKPKEEKAEAGAEKPAK
ncbi:30S ribosomal protein S6e [Candidatus Woesearchaeota archaeon]|nr:30S ribosomal protein S6e [Candidatus Woesearchaeota archaeon]